MSILCPRARGRNNPVSHMRFSFLLIPFAALTLASAASAQVAPFTIRVQQGATVSSLADGATITMAADAIGIASTASISISYTGTVTTPVTTFNTPDFSGSTDFTIGGFSDAINLLPKQSFAVNVAFKPATSNKVTGRIVFKYVESGKAGSFTLNLVGTAPEFAFSYIPQGGNATLIGQGGKIVYPVTSIDSTSSAVFVLTNRGSGAGNVGSIRIAG